MLLSPLHLKVLQLPMTLICMSYLRPCGRQICKTAQIASSRPLTLNPSARARLLTLCVVVHLPLCLQPQVVATQRNCLAHHLWHEQCDSGKTLLRLMS